MNAQPAPIRMIVTNNKAPLVLNNQTNIYINLRILENALEKLAVHHDLFMYLLSIKEYYYLVSRVKHVSKQLVCYNLDSTL